MNVRQIGNDANRRAMVPLDRSLTTFMPCRPIGFFLALAVAGIASTSRAQKPPHLVATRIAHAPVLNGDLTDPTWEGAPAATPFIDPFTGLPAHDQTEAKVLFDDVAIYVAFHCRDERPNEIVAREIVPDSSFDGEDSVQFEIDPFGTRTGASSSRFSVNAINTRTERIAGGRAAKAEWRGLWTSFVKRTPDGYVVEMRIPWKILSYPSSKKAIPVDVNFSRFQARTHLQTQWANTTPQGHPELRGFLDGLIPPAIDDRRRLQFLAYDAPGVNSGKFSNHAGLDARYALSKQTTGLLSIGPDFENIEQQIAGIDFVHTERFLDDARPFFTEGADYFRPVGDFNYGKPFNSQRIGQFDVGSKYFGTPSPSVQVGALTTHRRGGPTTGVFNVLNTFSPTLQQATYGTSYDVAGLHDRLIGTEINKKWNSWSTSLDYALEDNSRNTQTAGGFAVAYSSAKLFSSIQSEWVRPDFNPPLAYIPWQDRKGFYSYSMYTDQFAKGPVRDANVSVYMPAFYTYARKIQERGINVQVTANDRKDRQLSVSRNLVDYGPGTDDTYGVGYQLNSSNRFRQIGLNYVTGRQSGVRSRFFELKGSLRVLKKIDLGIDQAILFFSPDSRQTVATIGWEIDNHRSITGRYVNTNGDRNFFVSYRNSGLAGAEMYLIVGDPNATKFSRRVSLKFVWAF